MSLGLLTTFEYLSDFRSKQRFVIELEISKYKFLLVRWNEMLINKCLCELLLIVSQLILIKIELLAGWNVWRFQLLRENCL